MESNGLFPERWTTVQESIARLAGIALLTYDGRGALRAAARLPELCRLLAASPEGARRCAAGCGRQRGIAVAEGRSVFFRCHAGLHCFAAPVPAGAGTAGSLLGGLALEKAADVDRVAELARELALPDGALRRAVGDLPFASPRLLERAADLATRAAGALFTGERLLAGERSRAALHSSLLALGEEFARERDALEVCTTLLDAAAILLDLRGACLLVREERSGRFRLRASFGTAAAHLPAEGLPVDSPLLAAALRGQSPAVVTGGSRFAARGFGPGPSPSRSSRSSPATAPSRCSASSTPRWMPGRQRRSPPSAGRGLSP